MTYGTCAQELTGRFESVLVDKPATYTEDGLPELPEFALGALPTDDFLVGEDGACYHVETTYNQLGRRVGTIATEVAVETDALEMWAAMILDVADTPAPETPAAAAPGPQRVYSPTFSEFTGEFGPAELTFAGSPEAQAAWQPSGRTIAA